MTFTQFQETLFEQFDASPEIVLEPRTKIVVMSDFHAGDGSSRDDLAKNGKLLLASLERYYFERGSILVLNGDIEEMQKFSYKEISASWKELYAIFDRFAAENRLYKIIGNHDELILEEEGYPYPIQSGLKLALGSRYIFIMHGHQASEFYTNYNHVSRALIKYFVHTFGIKSLNVSRNSRRKFKIERRIYRFCQENGLVSIIGHTHRPLFESLSKFDRLRFTIENLCREYPLADEKHKAQIAATVADYKEEFGRLKRRERKSGSRLGIYDRDVLLPCLFNAGCAVGKKGITAIEIENSKISLVYWFETGKTRRYLERETAHSVAIPDSPYRRVVLSTDKLDYLFARIDLLA